MEVTVKSRFYSRFFTSYNKKTIHFKDSNRDEFLIDI